MLVKSAEMIGWAIGGSNARSWHTRAARRYQRAGEQSPLAIPRRRCGAHCVLRPPPRDAEREGKAAPPQDVTRGPQGISEMMKKRWAERRKGK